jgi:hypothetical protein
MAAGAAFFIWRNIMKVRVRWRNGQGVVSIPYRGYEISISTLMEGKPETAVFKSEEDSEIFFTSYGAGVDNILDCKEFIDLLDDAE